MGKGVLERFLYVLPKSHLGYRTHNTPSLSSELQATYNQRVIALLDARQHAESSLPGEEMQILSLSEEANAVWSAFQIQLESELRPDGLLGSYPGWGGKLAGFALRLAGLLHVAEYGLATEMIHVATMQNALRLIEVLRLHALTVFQWMCRDSASDDAQIVWQWIQTQGQGSFTQAEIRFALRNKKQGQSERLMKALVRLQERHLISPPVKLNTRKPTTLYRVNPLALFNSAV